MFGQKKLTYFLCLFFKLAKNTQIDVTRRVESIRKVWKKISNIFWLFEFFFSDFWKKNELMCEIFEIGIFMLFLHMFLQNKHADCVDCAFSDSWLSKVNPIIKICLRFPRWVKWHSKTLVLLSSTNSKYNSSLKMCTWTGSYDGENSGSVVDGQPVQSILFLYNPCSLHLWVKIYFVKNWVATFLFNFSPSFWHISNSPFCKQSEIWNEEKSE